MTEHVQTQADLCIEAAFACEDAGDWAGAIAQYHQALTLKPDYWRTHVNLGNALKTLAQFEAAHRHHQIAYDLNHESHSTCYNLGADLMRLGQVSAAMDLLQQAVALQPDFADAMVLMAEALESAGDLAQSAHWLRRVLITQPDNLGVLMNLLACEEKLGRYAEGEQTLQKFLRAAVQHSHENFDYMAEYIKQHAGVAEAVAYYRAMPVTGFNRSVFSNYLMNASYLPDMDMATLLAEHRRYNQFVQRADLSAGLIHRKSLCRIGFVSPDFRQHPVADFVMRLFELLPQHALQVYAYSASDVCDAATQRIQQAVQGWRDIHAMSAQAAAQVVLQDQIDILIDLAGHTAGNRLDVFALKPAPVTATWLGYLCTTGLDGIDFRIVDPYTDPIGLTEAHHSEQLARLSATQWCYLPWRDHQAVSPLPALRKGYITFGSFSHQAKLNDEVMTHWAQLMVQVEQSRIHIFNVREGFAQQRLLRVFKACGVDTDRVEFLQRMPFVQYTGAYHDVDVVLDSSPWSGGTTTCNALYMGVPVLTLAGQHSVARSGASLMSNVGLPEWVADSPEAFVAQGVRLVSDLPALAALRAGLRERMMASPVGDQDRFARDFAALLHQMWRRKA